MQYRRRLVAPPVVVMAASHCERCQQWRICRAVYKLRRDAASGLVKVQVSWCEFCIYSIHIIETERA